MLGNKVFDKNLWQLIIIFLKSFFFQSKVSAEGYVQTNRKDELSFDFLCYKINNMHLCQGYNNTNVICYIGILVHFMINFAAKVSTL